MGHYLERTQLHVIARRVGGYSGGFRCDLCGSSFSRGWVPLLHCSQCKYDVCPNCALSSVPNRGMPMMPQPGYGFPPQQPGYGYPPPMPPAAAPLMCDSGHPLMARPLSALQLENKGYSGGYICNRCRGRSNARGASPAEMVMHCPLCQYDLCPLCTAAAVQQQQPQPMPYPVPAAAPPMMMCERGHPLRATTISALGQVNPGYRGGYVCNRCRVGSGARGASLGEVVMHCDVCNFDLCPSCARAMQPPPMPYAQPMPYMQPPPYSPY